MMHFAGTLTAFSVYGGWIELEDDRIPGGRTRLTAAHPDRIMGLTVGAHTMATVLDDGSTLHHATQDGAAQRAGAGRRNGRGEAGMLL